MDRRPETFRASGGAGLIREAVELVLQELIEAEAAEAIGAGRYERSDTRVTERNGRRSRLLATQAGDVELKIPKLRKGSFFPSMLEPRHIEFPYVYLDATYLNVRNSVAQPVSMATVVATGITSDGNREVLGCDVGDSESEGFWQQFLGSLRDRGLTGVRLVICSTPSEIVSPNSQPATNTEAQPKKHTIPRNAPWSLACPMLVCKTGRTRATS